MKAVLEELLFSYEKVQSDVKSSYEKRNSHKIVIKKYWIYFDPVLFEFLFLNDNNLQGSS